jgi:hypothetical protein
MKHGEFPPPAEEPQEPEEEAQSGVGAGPDAAGPADALIADSVEALVEYVHALEEDPRVRAVEAEYDARAKADGAAFMAEIDAQGLQGAERKAAFLHYMRHQIQTDGRAMDAELDAIEATIEAEHTEHWRQRSDGDPID